MSGEEKMNALCMNECIISLKSKSRMARGSEGHCIWERKNKG